MTPAHNQGPATVAALVQPNVAVELAISAVTASAHQVNYPPENTVDHNFETRWSADGDNQWIQFELAEPQRVAFVRMAFYKGDQRQQRFALAVSTDGVVWRTLLTGSGNGKTNELQPTFLPQPETARYVRIVCHGNTVDMENSMTEVEVWGTSAETDLPPILPEKLPIQSAYASEKPLTAERTIDGMMVTRWSAQGAGKWLQYDLGQRLQIIFVRIAFFQGDSRKDRFAIQVSDDKREWREVFKGEASGETTYFQQFDLPPTEARLVRIVGMGNDQSSWNSISEVEIWGEHLLVDPLAS